MESKIFKQLTDEITQLCEEAGCSEKRAKVHLAQYVNRNWKAHPDEGFRRWWEPDGVNPISRAETGGHPEAYRKCVQPETGKVKYYGVKTVFAFNTKWFRDEYIQWISDGEPPRLEDYDGTAAPLEAQRNCFRQIKVIMKGSVSGVTLK